MGESEGKSFSRERFSQLALPVGVLLFLVLVWGGLGWVVYQLFGL